MANQQPLNNHEELGTQDDRSAQPNPSNQQLGKALPSTRGKVDLEPEVAVVSLIENWIDA